MTSLRKMYTNEMIRSDKNIELLNKTEAGQKALELDKADGKQDGKISASVWNEYAKAHGGNEIQDEINVVDAMNSITTYMVREEAKTHNADVTKIKEETLQNLQSLLDEEVKSQEPQFGL